MTGFMARLRTLAVPASVVLLLAMGAAGPAVGQAPPASQAPPAKQTPAGPQTPAAPPAAPPASPAPQTPPAAQPPQASDPPPESNVQRPDTLQPGDAFGEQVTLPEQTIVYAVGSGQWDHAFQTIVDAFKTVNAYLQKQGIKPSGPPMTIYTSTNDTSFQFWAAVPVADAPKDKPPGNIEVGKTTPGTAYKFIHRGSYDEMDTTYDAITNFLDEKQLDAKGLFIEQYDTDPITTPPDKLVVEVFVPLK
jgi:effector-binding domain-containing protein